MIGGEKSSPKFRLFLLGEIMRLAVRNKNCRSNKKRHTIECVP